MTVRPRLSRKVRLRFDPHTGRHLLLYPETGFELNDTATAIVLLCTGEWTSEEIVDHLTLSYVDASRGEISRATREFLAVLADRGLL